MITVIDDIEPDVDGVVVQVGVSVATQLVVENTTDELFEVLGEAGEPFLRIGPEGVEANLASPTWEISNSPLEGAVPAAAEPGAEPRWAQVSSEPSWGWFDHRLHPQRIDELGAGEELAWRVPIRYAGDSGEVRGHLERRTVLGTYTSRLLAGSDQPLPGVVVQLLDDRVPGLLLRTTGTEAVVVLGPDGEPFARIGPGGAEVNVRSPLWHTSAQARGEPTEGPVPDATAPPEWRVVSQSSSLSWIDDRGRWPAEEPPEAAAAAEATVVLDWRVPIVRGGERGEVRAVTAFVPLDAGTPGAVVDDRAPADVLSPRVVATGVAVVAAAAVLARHARARRRTTS